MTTNLKETGIEELRRLVREASYTREDALARYSAEEVLRLYRAVWASEWGIFPDALLPNERDYAARHGKLSAQTIARLRVRFG